MLRKEPENKYLRIVKKAPANGAFFYALFSDIVREKSDSGVFKMKEKFVPEFGYFSCLFFGGRRRF
jgi:hypothetical protein